MSGPLPVVACPDDWPGDATDLSGKVVLVVGASGGLGQTFARLAAKAGAEVVLAGRRVAALERLYDEIEGSGGKAALYPLNLAGASPADFAELATRLREQCSGLDAIIFCSAHLRGLCAIEHTPPEDWLAALHINLAAPLLLVQQCLPLLRESADAAIIFLVNGPETRARAYWGGYGAAQAGLTHLAATLHDELDNTPVRVHALDPGPMRTGLRQRVWFSEDPATVPSADRAAGMIAALVASGGIRYRGTLLKLVAPSSC